MPRKRRVNKAREQMTDMQWDFLCDRPLPKNFEAFAIARNSSNGELWNLYRDVILAAHTKETAGTRPALWWHYDAPRIPTGTFKDCHYDGQLPQPRERLGGIGTPACECRAVKPSFSFGIPNVWAGIDEDDPPVFESQAAYLKRHGLLLAGEERRADFEPEVVSTSWDYFC